ncbi:MBL fold metallo-hydrolase [Flavobacterium sp. ACAM 123]|uniref:MBL fold metallo-hydrolase n=1 Tax=Flavobacterium sp. ACAM 123 TaxID=1189620 RepID=UPI0018DE9FCF|nr:MBL fold metallo-hydrolase [Flavobacterium sp. ACAM 123]
MSNIARSHDYHIQVVTNDHFNANTYILKSNSNQNGCYLIDIGNYEGVIQLLEKNQYIKGIFLTHAHYDHICGINKIIDRFPHCKILSSSYTKEALRDSKMNLSFYHNTPITYNGNNIKVVDDQETLDLFQNDQLTILETPGHNKGSLSFKIGHAIFTGDSLIPDRAVITKLKSGNKVEALASIIKIKNNSKINDVIYPGHGESFEANTINWNFYL